MHSAVGVVFPFPTDADVGLLALALHEDEVADATV
jgi:hypothetical protein